MGMGSGQYLPLKTKAGLAAPRQLINLIICG